jgi:Flp pilus assembly pilin Flp
MKTFLSNQKGQGILEISLLVAVFVLVTVATVPSLRNSVINVFNKTSSSFNTTNTIEESPDTTPIWQPTQTAFGSSPQEISNNLSSLMIQYHDATGHWPPAFNWSANNGTGNANEIWRTVLDWKYPGQNVDTSMWLRNASVDGVIYTPQTNFMSIEPAPGYTFHYKTDTGETIDLEYGDYTGLGSYVQYDPTSMTWWSVSTDPSNHRVWQVADISTLTVTGPGLP